MSVKNDKTFCIYIHTNKTNGKKYVGQTCQKPERRFANGKGYKRTPVFKDAIKKYGWDNFIHEVVVDGLSLEEANKLEEKLIKELKTLDRKYGYNLAYGGGNRKLCESAKKKIGDFWRGKKMPQSQKEAISKANKGKNIWSKGKYPSEETKQKMKKTHQINLLKRHSYNPYKPILCLDTGIFYNSVSEASEMLGIDKTAIYKSIKNQNRRARKMKFVYLEKGGVI